MLHSPRYTYHYLVLICYVWDKITSSSFRYPIKILQIFAINLTENVLLPNLNFLTLWLKINCFTFCSVGSVYRDTEYACVSIFLCYATNYFERQMLERKETDNSSQWTYTVCVFLLTLLEIPYLFYRKNIGEYIKTYKWNLKNSTFICLLLKLVASPTSEV